MDYALVLSGLALAIAVLAVFRTSVPPQLRQVNEARGRIEDLEHDVDELHKRLNKRAQVANMSKARDEREEKIAGNKSLELEALRVLASGKAGAQAATPLTAGPDPDAERRRLRAAVFGASGVKRQH